MAYTPLGGNSVRDPTLARIGATHGCSAAAIALDAARGGHEGIREELAAGVDFHKEAKKLSASFPSARWSIKRCQ